MEENPDYYVAENNNKEDTYNEIKENNSEKLSIRKRWNNDYIKKARVLLEFLSPILAKTKEEIVERGTTLSYEFYNKNQKYCI